MKFPVDLLNRCWFLAGPTASGKSELAIHLAQQLPGEIVSMDSMAIYRGMDIGTAKPTPQQQAIVPHHLIDLIDPHEEFSTAQYFKAAQKCCEEIVARQRTPLFVGGTGLYLRAILRGVFEGPAADWEFREKLMTQAAQQSPDWLWQELRKVDEVTAARLHPNDSRRLIRALEVFEQTGTAPSVLQQETPLPESHRPQHVYWLHPPRDWLHSRINRRVEWMFEQGLTREVLQLLALPNPPGRTATQALGYREVIDALERSKDEDAAISSQQQHDAGISAMELIQTRTRQFAKRQHTWFRNLIECREVPFNGTETVDQLCERLQQMGTARQ